VNIPLLSVIIVNWNGKSFLKECLDSLAAQTFSDFETVVVDNGSTDGSAGYIRENYAWVRLVELPENAGFAAGNNCGLTECSGVYIVTLNNDTRVETGFLQELVKAAEADPGIGMVAAKMLNFHETCRIDSVGIRATTTGLGMNRGVGEPDMGQYDTPEEVFGACAGAALYRRAMLDEVGFFDPVFFAYYEDLDLAWRGRFAGWRCVTAPGAVAFHVHSATSGRMTPFTVYHVQRNKWYTIVKNWPVGLLFKSFPRIIFYDLGSIVLAALRGRLWAAMRARLQLLRDLPMLLGKRQEIKTFRKVKASDVERFLEHGGSPLRIFKRKMGSGV
jgi:GT2 family glycosyltransferase